MLWGFPSELHQTFEPIQDLLKDIVIRRSEPPSTGAFAQLCEVITEARHVARILLRGAGHAKPECVRSVTNYVHP